MKLTLLLVGVCLASAQFSALHKLLNKPKTTTKTVDCSAISACWQCSEVEECEYDLDQSACVPSGTAGQNTIQATQECTDAPDFFTDITACYTGNPLACFTEAGYDCGQTEFCQTFATCVMGVYIANDGEDCGFSVEDGVEQCDDFTTFYQCKTDLFFGGSLNCACPNQPTLDPSSGCIECLVSANSATFEGCGPNCAFCQDTAQNPACYYCDIGYIVDSANQDCSGACVPYGQQSNFCMHASCTDICTNSGDSGGMGDGGLDDDTDTDGGDDGGPCAACLFENGASFGTDCFQGDATNGACGACGFETDSSAADMCLFCDDDGFVVDVTDADACTGPCVPFYDATYPQVFHPCRETFVCAEECADDEDTEEDDGGDECGFCQFSAGARFSEDCAVNCEVCGYGDGSDAGDQCVFCGDGFDVQVMHADCTGPCVPEDENTNPLPLAIATESCTLECGDECYGSDELELYVECAGCLDDNDFVFGRGENCYENEDPSVVPMYNPDTHGAFSDYCTNMPKGSCSVCDGTDLHNEDKCLVCADGYELQVVNIRKGTGSCVPRGCSERKLDADLTDNECVRICEAAFGSFDDDDEGGDDDYDPLCDPIYEVVQEVCTSAHPTTTDFVCPKNNPSTTCCRTLALLEESGCSVKTTDALGGQSLDGCSFRPSSTTQVLNGLCSSVSINRKRVSMAITGVRSDLESAGGRLALLKTIAALTGLSVSQIRLIIQAASVKQESVNVDVELLGSTEELASVEDDLEDETSFVSTFTTQKAAVETQLGVTLSDLSGTTVGTVGTVESVSSTDLDLQVCEQFFTDSGCGTASGDPVCYSTEGATCDQVLRGTKGDRFDALCQGDFVDYDECCTTDGTDGDNGFSVTCGEVTAATTSNRVCTELYTGADCSGTVTTLCVTHDLSCDEVLTLYGTTFQDACAAFSGFDACCNVGDGTSAVVTCNPDAPASALQYSLALVLSLFVSFLLF